MRNGWDTGDWDSYEDVMQQQIADQDQSLDHISIHVDRIRQTGQAMNDELEQQVGGGDDWQWPGKAVWHTPCTECKTTSFCSFNFRCLQSVCFMHRHVSSWFLLTRFMILFDLIMGHLTRVGCSSSHKYMQSY